VFGHHGQGSCDAQGLIHPLIVTAKHSEVKDIHSWWKRSGSDFLLSAVYQKTLVSDEAVNGQYAFLELGL
jgi:hypothetical protein